MRDRQDGAQQRGALRVRSWACCAGLVLGVWASSVHAEPAPVWVWYRSSEGCPDGSSFVVRLAELGQAARLAGVGDRVDFVVTLGRVADSSSGRLERQTHGGTVAIREYRDARCEQVAEALALTLDLALEPQASPPVVAVAPTVDPGLDAAKAQTPASAEQRAPIWRVGPQALLQSGVAAQPAFGGALFAGVEDPAWFVRQLRAALFVLHAQGRRPPRSTPAKAPERLSAADSGGERRPSAPPRAPALPVAVPAPVLPATAARHRPRLRRRPEGPRPRLPLPRALRLGLRRQPTRFDRRDRVDCVASNQAAQTPHLLLTQLSRRGAQPSITPLRRPSARRAKR